MAGINAGRVVAAGLLAGVAANVCDTVWSFTVMKDDMVALSQRLNVPLDTSFSGNLPWMIVDFVLGFLVVFTYAAIRPRFGPGPKTAVIAGLVVLVATSAVVYGFASMGLMSMESYSKGVATSVVTSLVASLVGGWAYKEA